VSNYAMLAPVNRAPASHRRADERERRRGQILRAAAHLFASKGLENVTFGDIARKTRLSRPLVYFYFPDQTTLFLEAVLVARQSLQRRFEEAVARGKNGLEQIDNIGRAYIAFHLEEPDAFRLCSLYDANPAYSSSGHALDESLEASEQRIHGLCIEAIEHGRRDGSIRPDIGSSAEVALVLWGCVLGMAQLASARADALSAHGGLTPEQFIDAGMALLNSALRTRT
jgi:AcrR family transcriptional regulator